jgi:hypothetical protein
MPEEEKTGPVRVKRRGSRIWTHQYRGTLNFYVAYQDQMAIDNVKLQAFLLNFMQTKSDLHENVRLTRLWGIYAGFDKAGNYIQDYAAWGTFSSSVRRAVATFIRSLDDTIATGTSGAYGILYTVSCNVVEELK